MKQKLIKGETIQEYTVRSNDIQYDMEELLALLAAAHGFNWTGPLHDLVRSIMNAIHEFRPVADEEP